MALEVGSRLGSYEIQSPLGAGGMGEVYKATDTRLDRTVAIKVLLAHVADDPDLRQRFEREAKTISSLNHPHICTLHDIGQQDGIDYLVMEYLEGETLAARISTMTVPDLGTILDITSSLTFTHQCERAVPAGECRGRWSSGRRKPDRRGLTAGEEWCLSAFL